MRKPKPLTDVQLSMILGEHSARQMCRYGATEWKRGSLIGDILPLACAGQVALNECHAGSLRIPEDFVHLFDQGYEPFDTPEQLLDLLKDARL